VARIRAGLYKVTIFIQNVDNNESEYLLQGKKMAEKVKEWPT
jgi:hypothetical protein